MDPRAGSGFSCSTCLKTLTSKAGLKYHMFTHDVNAKVKCKICGKVSKNPLALSVHIRMLHTSRDRPSYDICHRVFYTSTDLRRHIGAVHSTIERPRFQCGFPDCDKSYPVKDDVSKHTKREHTENPTRFPCALCGKEFKTRRVLLTHITTHTTEKAYICSVCGRRFPGAGNLKSHEVTHLEKSTRRIFKCERCPQMCSRRSDLQKHVKVVHENQRNHSCTFCDKTCSTSGNLRRHVEARHSANRDKIHSCDKCDYVTHSKVYLAQHVRRHNPANRPECYFCRKKFCNFSRLVTHCRRHTLE